MAVRQLAGVTEVDGDARQKTVTVSYDPERVAIEQIQRALSDIGHPSSVAE